MKRTIFIFAALAVLSSVMLSCEKTKPVNPGDDDNPDNPKAAKLETPVLTVSEITGNSITVTWGAIENAAGYESEINGTKSIPEGTSATFTDLVPGEYTIKVRAMSGDTEKYTDSEWAQTKATIEAGEQIRAEAYYAGDYYDAGSGNCWINFIKGDITVDDDGNAHGNGMILCIDLNITLADNPDFAALDEGTYEITGDRLVPSMNGEGDSYCIISENGKTSGGSITGGTVEIKKGSSEYTYETVCELQTEDGSKVSLSYTGLISLINHSGSGQMSNLREDVTLTTLTQGSQTYFGDLFELGESELYMIVLADSNYDLETNFGTGENIVLYFNVPVGSENGLPAGTYEGMLDLNTASSAPVGTCLGGLYDYGTYMGCWYFNLGKQIEASFKDGKFTVEKDGDNYRIKGSGTDGHGNEVTIDYEGQLRMAVQTSASEKGIRKALKR